MFIQEYSSKAWQPEMLQTLESLSWSISLTVLLHNIESEQTALFETGDHRGLQAFAKALTLRNYEQLWCCNLAQVLPSRINSLVILTASLVKVYRSFQIFAVNMTHSQELWTLETLKLLTSEHSARQLGSQWPLVLFVHRGSQDSVL